MYLFFHRNPSEPVQALKKFLALLVEGSEEDEDFIKHRRYREWGTIGEDCIQAVLGLAWMLGTGTTSGAALITFLLSSVKIMLVISSALSRVLCGRWWASFPFFIVIFGAFLWALLQLFTSTYGNSAGIALVEGRFWLNVSGTWPTSRAWDWTADNFGDFTTQLSCNFRYPHNKQFSFFSEPFQMAFSPAFQHSLSVVGSDGIECNGVAPGQAFDFRADQQWLVVDLYISLYGDLLMKVRACEETKDSSQLFSGSRDGCVFPVPPLHVTGLAPNKVLRAHSGPNTPLLPIDFGVTNAERPPSSRTLTMTVDATVVVTQLLQCAVPSHVVL
jgi:hypothetical protein